MIVISWGTFWFIVLAVVMVLLALLILGLPWMRREVTVGMDRTAFNVQVYRDQLAELETDMKEKRIEGEEYRQAREDLERGILQDTQGGGYASEEPQGSGGGDLVPGGGMPPPPPSPSSNAGRWAIVVIGVTLPVLALVLYALINVSIKAISPGPEDVAAQAPAGSLPPDHPEVGGGAGGAAASAGAAPFSPQEMVNRLAKRLKENPNDARGWTMLGRSYTVMERYEDSVFAYGKAYDLRKAEGLGALDADLVADYAGVLVETNGNQITPQAGSLIDQALQLNGDNHKALWLGGLAAFRAEDYSLAAQRWRRLSQLLPAGSEMEKVLAGALEEADVRAGNIDVNILVEEPAEATDGAGAAAAAPVQAAPPGQEGVAGG